MKRLFTIAALLLSALLAYGQQTRTYVVGFYNLENLFDIYDDPAKQDQQFLPDGSNHWTQVKYEKKQANMAHVIAEMAKENGRYHTILGVSEVENRMVLEDLVSESEIADANYQIVHYDSPDRRGIDVALLYKPEQFTFLDSEAIPFTFEGSDIDFTDTDTDYFRTRDILMVHGTIDGEHFAFYVMHLPSRGGGKGSNLRSRGAEIAYNHAMRMMEKYPGIKIVAMGDMNDDPTDPSMTDYLHSRETLEATGQEDFFNPFCSILGDGIGSICYKGEWSLFDQILINSNLTFAPDGGLKIKQINKGYYGRVFKKRFMETKSGQYKGYPLRTFSNGTFLNGYSDHYPTYIVISKTVSK